MSWLNQLTSQFQNFANGLDQDGNPTYDGRPAAEGELDIKALLDEKSRLQDSLLQLDQQYQEERSQMILIKDELQLKLQRAEAELNALRSGAAPSADHEVDLEETWENNWGMSGDTQHKLDERAHEVVELQKSLDEAQRQLSTVTELKTLIDGLKHENLLLKNRLEAMQEENEMLENELESRAFERTATAPSATAQCDYEGFCKDVVSTLLGGTELSEDKLKQAREDLKHFYSKMQDVGDSTDSICQNLAVLHDQKNAVLAEKAALEDELSRFSEVETELKRVRGQLKKATDEKTSLATKVEKSMRSQAELQAQITQLSSRSSELVVTDRADSEQKTLTLETLLEQEKHAVQRLEHEFEEFKQNALHEAELLKAALSEQESVARESQHSFETLKKQSDVNLRREAALTQEIANLQSLLSELQGQNAHDHDESSRLLRQTREKDSEIQQLQAELCLLNEQLAESEQKIVGLESSVSELRCRDATSEPNEQIATLKQQLETSEQELELLRHSRDSVSNELEVAENGKQQLLAQMLQESEAMKIVKASFDESLKQLSGENEQILAVVSEKSRENADLRSKLDGLMNALSAEKQARLQSEQRTAHVRQQLEEQQNQQRTLQQQTQQLEQQNQRLTEQNRELLEQQAQQQQQQWTNNTAQNVALELQEQITTLQNEYQTVSRTLSHKSEENAELRQRIQKLLDNESKMNFETQRLTSHLVEVEETYTKEAIVAKQQVKTLQQRLTTLEESIRNTDNSTQAITAQASQKVEMLEAELVQASSQRDEALDQVSTLEDQLQQSAVSLASLQLVLEHMQSERDNGAKSMKRHTEAEQKKLYDRIAELETALSAKEETLKNLSETVEATSRLTHQLQEKNSTLGRLQQKLNEKEHELQEALQKGKINEGAEGKVQKQLIKNMLLGYFTAAPDKKAEVLRCITGYLEFSDDESRRVSPGGSRGLFGIFGGSQANQAPDPNDSFTNQLIAYIEKESAPSTPLRLPTGPAAVERLRKVSSSSSSSCPPEQFQQQIQRQMTSSPFRPDNPLFSHLPASPISPLSTSSRASTTSEPEMLREILAQPGTQ